MIVHADCSDYMETLKTDSVDLVCTDPPYGYSFMGKDWDKAVPGVEIWKECLRVLKPGAFLFCMSAPRSDVQMHMITNLTAAGFRLDFTPIYWTYASGFPKAGNIGKLVDKRLGAEREIVGERVQHDIRNNSYATKKTNFVEQIKGDAVSDQAKALDGSYAGFQPKPAVEVIIVAMKPLTEKTYVDQALANGHGVTWLDDCRVPAVVGTQGRFPANLLVGDDVLNDGLERESPTAYKRNVTGHSGFAPTMDNRTDFGDSGSYSRYFDLDKWAQTLPFLIVSKASKSEKNKGLEQLNDKITKYNHFNAAWRDDLRSEKGYQNKKEITSKNHHPTVKPLKLMSYLITLGSREGDTVLDPFCGSGTTCVAANKLRRQYIGIERELEYAEIAKARLRADKQETLL